MLENRKTLAQAASGASLAAFSSQAAWISPLRPRDQQKRDIAAWNQQVEQRKREKKAAKEQRRIEAARAAWS